MWHQGMGLDDDEKVILGLHPPGIFSSHHHPHLDLKTSQQLDQKETQLFLPDCTYRSVGGCACAGKRPTSLVHNITDRSAMNYKAEKQSLPTAISRMVLRWVTWLAFLVCILHSLVKVLTMRSRASTCNPQHFFVCHPPQTTHNDGWVFFCFIKVSVKQILQHQDMEQNERFQNIG